LLGDSLLKNALSEEGVLLVLQTNAVVLVDQVLQKLVL
jgi:hypothetical protein